MLARREAWNLIISYLRMHRRPAPRPWCGTGPGGRGACDAQRVQQAPPAQPGDAGDLHLMGGDGVAAATCPVHQQRPDPWRASSMAVAAPVTRAPTMIRSCV